MNPLIFDHLYFLGNHLSFLSLVRFFLIGKIVSIFASLLIFPAIVILIKKLRPRSHVREWFYGADLKAPG